MERVFTLWPLCLMSRLPYGRGDAMVKVMTFLFRPHCDRNVEKSRVDLYSNVRITTWFYDSSRNMIVKRNLHVLRVRYSLSNSSTSKIDSSSVICNSDISMKLTSLCSKSSRPSSKPNPISLASLLAELLYWAMIFILDTHCLQ